MDEDGDFMFLGRKDEQVQVQGYRVELGEVEQVASRFLNGSSVVAMGKADRSNQMRIFLFVEAGDLDHKAMMNYLGTELPHYMMPLKAILLDEFPKLVSGKLDRKTLIDMIQD